MENVIKYIALGVIQGLTEFLPLSSSAHLVIFQELFQMQKEQILLYNIVLHAGSLLALVVFLSKDIKHLLQKKVLFYICLATALTAVVVILGKGFFESLFLSSRNLAAPLLITGIILLFTSKFTKGKRAMGNLKITDAFWLGIAQGLSVIPGLSRSGITIATLLFRNVERETAFKFSFLSSIPAILGALIFKINELSQISFFEYGPLLCGFFASFLSGLLALKILFTLIRQARLYLFGYYCVALSLFLFWLMRAVPCAQ